MLKVRLNLRKVATIACLAVTSIMFSGCEKDDPVNNLPPVDEEGLTGDIRNIIPDEYIETLKDLGLEIYGGNTPPNIEGTYRVSPMDLVNCNFCDYWHSVAKSDNMYVTFFDQINKDLTVKMDYDMWTENGDMGASGLGAFIVGEGNKFTVFVEAERRELSYTAKTVEVFSGEITTKGIKDFQWAVIMIDNKGNPTGHWIGNGQAYVKKDGDGLSERINLLTLPDNNKYHKGIAETAAVYAMLAYETSRINSYNPYNDLYPGWILFNNPSSNRIVYSGKKGDNYAYSNTEPTLLKKQLELDGYNSVKSENYGDNNRNNISYTFAKRAVNSNEVLLAVILRGTDGVEWYGNMEVGYDIRHGNFELANKSLQNDIKTFINNTCNGKKINFFITGHSRGAAIGNLLAADITSGLFSYSNIGKVFGYFFATPNNTTETNAEGKYNNIFNFCFSDDFVPQVPLPVWGYKKYGTTFLSCADDTYKNDNGTFKTMMNAYSNLSKSKNAPEFNKVEVGKVLEEFNKLCPNISSYYEEKEHIVGYIGGTPVFKNVSVFYFMQNYIAGSAVGDWASIANLATEAGVPIAFYPIRDFFVAQANKAVNDTHQSFTYWIALKCNKFDMRGYVDGGGDLVE